MRLIVAANRAPVSRTEDGGWSTSVGGLTTALLPVLQDQGGVWVGSNQADATLPERLPYPEDDPAFVVRHVPVSEEELDAFYYGMANRVLWPVSHYLAQHLSLEPSYIDAYRALNRRFAEAVAEEYEEGDYVCLQDYHLMLTAQYIREARPEATISLFWHIPWPAMEVFRILPWSRELLRGMLGCDLVGFHIDEYVDNFVESARVLLGAETEGNVIHWEGRQVRAQAHPLGIDMERFAQMAGSEDVKKEEQAVRQEVETEFFLVGIDRLDYTKGILTRLLAFEQFLEDYPDYHGRVAFYQVATPSRTEVDAYQQLKREVDEAVGRINGAFGRDDWTPVHYRYRTYTQQELCAFYRTADAAVITPLRDGMNLVAQEYVATNDHGVLILSELSGAAYLLPEALQINPYDQESLPKAIKQALEMPEAEKKERLAKLKERLAELDVHRWADGFLDAMTADA